METVSNPESHGWEEKILSPGDKVFFTARTPRWGVAEFEFCHAFRRGELRAVRIYPLQQGVRWLNYIIDCHGRSDFQIRSFTYKGIDRPDVWRQFWCREHDGFVMRLYVPENANHFVVGYGDVHFDYEEQPNGTDTRPAT